MAPELLELTRIESGQVPLEFKPVAGGKPAASLPQTGCAPRPNVPDCRCIWSLSAETVEVRADAPRLEQVLVNLIHNAIKFTRPGGELILSAQVEGNSVRFQVQDTGAGIPAEDLERIFERFYKADRARSGGGTGLGLSIARHIVEAHGGRIWAESMEGRGSSFISPSRSANKIVNISGVFDSVNSDQCYFYRPYHPAYGIFKRAGERGSL